MYLGESNMVGKVNIRRGRNSGLEGAVGFNEFPAYHYGCNTSWDVRTGEE